MMTDRERFIGVLRERDPMVSTLKWEFGYWGETINKWYKQGLPKVNPVRMLERIVTPTSGLFLPAWRCKNKYIAEGEYPKGFVHCAGGLSWPTQGMGLDSDVRQYFNMHQTQQVVDVNLLFYPMFEVSVEDDSDDRFVYWDVDGIKKLFLKEPGVMPSGLWWPVTNWDTWNKIKEERVSLKNIRDRLPDDWDQKIVEYKNRDYPLGIGGLPFGLFGTLAHTMGYENLFIAYYDEPELIHDIMNTFTELWIAVMAEVLKDVRLDYVEFWEDISMGTGSMISSALMREFMLPYYKRITSFGRENGIDIFFVDTDGYCMKIIDIFLEGGITAMYPFEVHAGMDVMEVKNRFPDLAICGGIDKLSITFGKDKIDEMLAHIEEVVKLGGYIPHCDHLVPPEVGFKEFEYYRNRLNGIIDKIGA
jgi:uroporphyrinogen decarboxylase